MSALFAHTDYYDTSFDVFKGLKPHIENLKNKLEEDRAVQIANRPKIISMKKTLEEVMFSKKPNQLKFNTILGNYIKNQTRLQQQ